MEKSTTSQPETSQNIFEIIPFAYKDQTVHIPRYLQKRYEEVDDDGQLKYPLLIDAWLMGEQDFKSNPTFFGFIDPDGVPGHVSSTDKRVAVELMGLISSEKELKSKSFDLLELLHDKESLFSRYSAAYEGAIKHYARNKAKSTEDVVPVGEHEKELDHVLRQVHSGRSMPVDAFSEEGVHDDESHTPRAW